MKQFKKFLVLIAVVFTAICVVSLPSCTQDGEVSSNSIEEVVPDVLSISDQEYIGYLSETMGFKGDEIQIGDSMIVVEGDIVFPKKNLQKAILEPPLQLRTSYRSQYKVTAISSIPVNINAIKVNGLIVLGWRQAVTDAVANWNSLSGNISLYVVDTPSSLSNGVNISIGTVSDNNNDAEANFPSSNGYPGPTIVININRWNANYWTNSNREALMTHELGHTIGLAHSDTNPPENGMIYIPTSCGTSYDSNSIMHHIVGNWNGFSSCDIEAFDYLY